VFGIHPAQAPTNVDNPDPALDFILGCAPFSRGARLLIEAALRGMARERTLFVAIQVKRRL
jgi:hypothetical protein